MQYPIWTESLQVERLTIPIANLPPALVGTKLVQLSDLHYDGFRLSEDLLDEAIAISNEEEPALVLLTGDYITDSPAPIDELVLRLKYLESRLGIYACLGNHDIYYPTAKADVTAALTRVGIEVLWNAIATPFGESFPVVGLADYWSREFKPAPVMDRLPPEIPRLVLSHNPDTAAILKAWRVDLQLSGHTHGGQVVIPGLGSAPLMLQQLRKSVPNPLKKRIPCSHIVKHWQWAQGLHKVGQNQLYVNRGLGTYFPGRFCCPPELTVITLV